MPGSLVDLTLETALQEPRDPLPARKGYRTVQCRRCHGLSVATGFGDDQWREFDGWRCLNCGDVVDAVILTNRECDSERGPMSMSAKGIRGARGAVSAKLIRLTR